MEIFQETDLQTVPKIIEVLNRGDLMLYPTDTIYGLGCDASQPSAVKKLKDLKGRDGVKPFLVLAKSEEAVSAHFKLPPLSGRIPHWPGPHTLLLEPTGDALAHMLGPSGKVGVRVPQDAFLRNLLNRWDGFLVSTSANPGGSPYVHDFTKICGEFPHLDLAVERSPYPVHSPSSIWDWNGSQWYSLR